MEIPRAADTGAALPLFARVAHADDVLAAASDGEMLLVRETSHECYVLRGSGVDIWHAATEPVELGTICETLQRSYAVDRATCERSLLEIVADLLRHGLLVRVD